MLIDSLENKQKILHNFLKICLFEGWNEKALKEAFVASNIETKFIPFVFENGALDVADFFVEEIDQKMQEAAKDIDFGKMKIRDKIKNLVKIRLRINEEFKPQIQKLVHFYLNPKNTKSALKNSYQTADLMWKIAGDSATDFNYYSKRAILAKIYIRVLFSFARDESKNYQKTLNLLDAEIEKVMQFAAFKFKVKNNFQNTLQKAAKFKQDLCDNPQNIIKKLPFFRLYK
jgi:ubiquinone biosynthesis protein COQ9